LTATNTPTLTQTPTQTATNTPTLTATNTPTLTATATPPNNATINWSNTQAEGSGYFIDSNLQINYTDTSGNAQTLTATDNGSGTITVRGGSSVSTQAYCFTSTPPTYWGGVSAASINIVADGTTVNTPLTVGSDTGTQTASHIFTATAGSTKSVAASSTATIPPANAVSNLSANAFDILGEIYVGAVVTVTSNVASDTLFTVVVSTSLGDVTVYVTISSGNNSGNAETFTGMGSVPDILGACISGCDDPNIVLTGYTC
jgi:hypothetical protein